MKVLLISGSNRQNSTNKNFLVSIVRTFKSYEIDFCHSDIIFSLPLFHSNLTINNNPNILKWKELVSSADKIIICTPEYLHNIPAAIKNAFEWCFESGEFHNKSCLAITMTPHSPRGEKAMVSLCNSLIALHVNLEGSLHLHKSSLKFDDKKYLVGEELEIINYFLFKEEL